MKSLFGKILVGALGFAAAIGVSAYAADIEDLKVTPAADLSGTTAEVTVTGKIAKDAEATILVAESDVSVLESIEDGQIRYIDQNTVAEDGTFSFKFVLNTGRDYNVWCGGTDVTAPAKGLADLTPEAAAKFQIVGKITVAGKYDDATAAATPAGAAEIKGTVAADGNYTIEVDPGTYTVTVGKPGYLYKTYSGVAVSETTAVEGKVDLKEIALLAGEFNDDGKINITDLTAFLGSYEKDGFEDRFDVNDDGKVNITDLTSVLSGYEKIYE